MVGVYTLTVIAGNIKTVANFLSFLAQYAGAVLSCRAGFLPKG